MMLVGIVGALLAAAGLIAVIGSLLPKTHIAASRIVLATPVDDVWRVITDFRRYPDWRPGLVRVEDGPEIDGLPSWYEVCSLNVRVHFRVVECDPPNRLVTRLDDSRMPLSGAWIYELRALDGGTEVTITEQDNIYNPLLRFFTRFIVAYHGVMDVFLIALARSLDERVEPEHLSLCVGLAGMDR